MQSSLSPYKLQLQTKSSQHFEIFINFIKYLALNVLRVLSKSPLKVIFARLVNVASQLMFLRMKNVLSFKKSHLSS